MNPQTNLPKYIGVDELSQILSVSPSWIYDHIRTIPHLKVGRYLRFDVSEVLASFKSKSYNGSPCEAQ